MPNTASWLQHDKTRKLVRALPMIIFASALAACGGGGGGGGSSSSSPTGSTTTTPPAGTGSSSGPVGISNNYMALAKQCAAPRAASTVDPFTGELYGDTQGTLLTENEWIRDFVYDTYLWYPDVPTVDPSTYVLGASVPYTNPATNSSITETVTTDHEVVDAYFNSQRSPLFTASGKPKDQFHFTYVTSDWVALEQTGAVPGYGETLQVLAPSPPRKVVVAFTDPGTPAAAAGLVRGSEIVGVDGNDVVNQSSVTAINEALFSPAAGESHTIQFIAPNSTTTTTVTLTAAVLTEHPVQLTGTLPAPNSTVGYMLFNEHIATAESDLIAAVNTLKAANNGAGITDLVLDIRYNGGGLLDIASELASMITTSAAGTGQTFEKESFNDKNPFNLTASQATTPFWQITQGFSTTAGVQLPHLNLGRVFVVTTAATCSASEAIINGLRGVGVTVIQIGSTTCGKPYGFFATDNCSTTYFAIQFEGVNAAGFGGYADGFVPTTSNITTGNEVPGCVVADDFSHPLGDPAEANLAAALGLINGASCPAPTSLKMPRDAQLVRPLPLQNRILHLERLQARPRA